MCFISILKQFSRQKCFHFSCLICNIDHSVSKTFHLFSISFVTVFQLTDFVASSEMWIHRFLLFVSSFAKDMRYDIAYSLNCTNLENIMFLAIKTFSSTKNKNEFFFTFYLQSKNHLFRRKIKQNKKKNSSAYNIFQLKFLDCLTHCKAIGIETFNTNIHVCNKFLHLL